MRIIHLLTGLMVCTSLLNGQTLIRSQYSADETTKSYTFQNDDGSYFESIFLYNSNMDSVLFAQGPIAVNKEDNAFVQNGVWTYYFDGVIADEVPFVLGDEHSASYLNSFHVGQSYTPIPFFHYSSSGANSTNLLPDWTIWPEPNLEYRLEKENVLNFLDNNTSVHLAFPPYQFLTSKNLIAEDVFRFQFDFALNYETPFSLFEATFADDMDQFFQLNCKGDGQVSLLYKSNEAEVVLVDEMLEMDLDQVHQVDFQLNASGDFVLVFNNIIHSTRNLENNGVPFSASNFAKLSTDLNIQGPLDVQVLDCSTLRFDENSTNKQKGVTIKDLSEINLALVNDKYAVEGTVVYMKELETIHVVQAFNSKGASIQSLVSFPMKYGNKVDYQTLELDIQLDESNRIKGINRLLEGGKREAIDLVGLSKYLNNKFGSNTYRMVMNSMMHKNAVQALSYASPSTNVKTTGELFELTKETSLRIGASASARVILRFEPDDQVDLIERTDVFWWKVKFNGKVGYVKAALLEKTAN